MNGQNNIYSIFRDELSLVKQARIDYFPERAYLYSNNHNFFSEKIAGYSILVNLSPQFFHIQNTINQMDYFPGRINFSWFASLLTVYNIRNN
jgi:hypothetical protein